MKYPLNKSGQAILLLPLVLAAAAVPGQADGLPDVAGFQPGIPFEEIYSRLKAYNRIAKVEIGEMPFPELGPKLIQHGFVLAEDGEASAELIEADVTLPPDKQVVWRVTRKLRFMPGKAPLMTKMVEALHEKYGPESIPMGMAMTWFFNEQGKRATETGGLSFNQCSSLEELPAVNAGIMQGFKGPQYNLVRAPVRLPPFQEGCRSLVSVRALVQPSQDPALAGVLTVSVTDHALQARAAQATADFIANAAGAQRKQELDKANKQAIPKL